MNQKNAGCIVTLGGDGTNRAVAKDIGEIPMISISTGTNNVYPDMIEGTIAGIAAAVVASHKFDKNAYSNRDKIIEIYTDGQLRDIALIDAVISRDIFVGSRAIWRVEDIEKIFVARSHPASIGFSAVVGGKTIITEADDYGAYVSIDKDAPKIKIPMSAGIVLAIGTSEPVILNFNEKHTLTTYCRGTIALDGEREIEFHQNQDFTFKISRNGPWHVDVKKAIEVGQKNGFFKVL